MLEASSERRVLFVIGAVQFVHIVDFMLVMPLGPDFAVALGIPTSALGVIGGCYSAAAAASGLAAAPWLDRFDRARALAVAMLGFALAATVAALASDLPTLIAARIGAGAFAGPAASLSLSIVADVIPPERRGRAIGAVMGAFAVASVVGVPLGLELGRWLGWRAPFVAITALALVVTALVAAMPSLRGHLARTSLVPRSAPAFLRQPGVLPALAGTATLMMANFAILPNLPAFLQRNLGYPRDRMWLLYLVGGIAIFFVMRAVGALVDRQGATRAAALGSVVMIVVLVVGFALPSGLPVMVLFVGYMVGSAARQVALNTASTWVPLEAERARFLSAQSAVQHLAAAAGALLSSRLLVESAGGTLEGMTRVAWLAIALTVALPVLVWMVEQRLAARSLIAGIAPKRAS